MELDQAIAVRRSVRQYADKKVDQSLVRQMVEAAQLAPSWKNFQPARFYAVMSDELLEKVRAECLPDFNARSSAHAVLIVTTFVRGLSGFDRDGSQCNELGDAWGMYDLGLQCQNLMLKATELGLGTLVMGIRDADRLRAMLNIDAGETVAAVIAVGWPAQAPAMRPRLPIDQVVKFF